MDSSWYSMDSKRLLTTKQCLCPLPKQGASMNGYVVWIFSFYPNFYIVWRWGYWHVGTPTTPLDFDKIKRPSDIKFLILAFSFFHVTLLYWAWWFHCFLWIDLSLFMSSFLQFRFYERWSNELMLSQLLALGCS